MRSSNCMCFLLGCWLSTVHGQATGDTQHLAGDIGGIVAGKEQNGSRQIIGLSYAAEWNGTPKGLLELFRTAGAFLVIGKQRGVGGTGTHNVHRNSVPRMFACDCFRERDKSALTGCIYRLA